MEYERAAKLQSILVSYAPTPADADGCERIYQRMLSNNELPSEVEKQIVGALADGLRYGNWPWTYTGWTGRVEN